MNTVIITGANGQLGKAIENKYLAENFDIVKVDLYSKSKPLGLQEYSVDITNENEVNNFFEKLNVIDDEVHLINCAGVGVFTPMADRTLEEFTSVFKVNLLGTFLMTRCFVNKFKKSSKIRSVVNIGSIYGSEAPDFSIYGDTPRMSSEIYGMTKAGVIYFTKYCASYYKDLNFRFNCVSPGGIEANQGAYFKEKYSEKVPMGRMAHEDEVAQAVFFIASKGASYINGENIFVDGGFTKW